jgi:hypothetical protein
MLRNLTPMSAATEGEREVFRLAPPVILWWVWLAFVAVNAADFAVQGLPSARFGAVVAAILLLVTGLACTLALRPKVIASDDGITVVNPYRTHFVPWRLVTAVSTGEWVKVHYAPAGDSAAGDSAADDSAGGRIVHCWALYVSARARRKIAAGPARPRDPLPRGLRRWGRSAGLGTGAGPRAGAGSGAAVGYAQPPSRMPEEARYLASLPPARAIAVGLDSRAGRERARATNNVIHDDLLDNSKTLPQVTVALSWPAIAAVAVPAAILLAIAVA